VVQAAQLHQAVAVLVAIELQTHLLLAVLLR
jgi:hypothetical protein